MQSEPASATQDEGRKTETTKRAADSEVRFNCF